MLISAELGPTYYVVVPSMVSSALMMRMAVRSTATPMPAEAPVKELAAAIAGSASLRAFVGSESGGRRDA